MPQLDTLIAANPQKLLTVEEVAALLRVPRSWIYGRTRRGAIPARRIGKYVRFDATEIAAWSKEGCPERWETVHSK